MGVGKKYGTAGFTKTDQTEEAMDEWAALLKERVDVLRAKYIMHEPISGFVRISA